ncbi:beta-ketoacyl-[acyl-carrier-protein] synthase family protein [Streptomyces sp. NPDC051776]|uniref:beta-ketoacyl-[acyl-carrier-protein] synthase family protein n=1 Tax=Streptomyces sp. NPDC051776 TaxID=3155414 RepID=UPI0034141952
MRQLPKMSNFDENPHICTCGELVPGDVLVADGANRFAVLDASPADEEHVRLTLRAVHGGPDFHAVHPRTGPVEVAGERVDPESVPLIVPTGPGVDFHDGDHMSVLDAARSRAAERHFVRRDGAWHAETGTDCPGAGTPEQDSDGGTPLTDDEMRALMARDPQALVCRLDPVPRPPRGGRRVVVTGVGAISPLGGDAAATWQGLLDGRSGVRRLDGEEFADLAVGIAAPSAVEPSERLPRARARAMSRSAQFAVLAAREAWADAGFQQDEVTEGTLDARRVGVSIGTIIGGAPVLVDADRTLADRGPRHVSPHTAPMIVPSGAAAQVAIDTGARAEARTVVSACASGTEAIGQAIDRIRDGHADVVVAGGTEAVIIPAIMASFASMRALSPGTDGPEKASRPFDTARDGFVVGEGAGLLILESEDHARARGARIYCEAAGWGVSADAFHMAAPRPDGGGVIDALHKALDDAGAKPDEVMHVNAHATATGSGDAAEALALRAVFGERPAMPVTAPKGAMGHLQGAAGGVEAVAAVLTLYHGVVPPTVGCEEPDDSLGLDVVTGAPRPLPESGDVALSNSFGFGGHNAVLALRRARAA